MITPTKKLVKRITPQQSPYKFAESRADRIDDQPNKNELLRVEDENKGLNESTVIEPIDSEITLIRSKKQSMNHYYEIQEVYCNLNDDD